MPQPPVKVPEMLWQSQGMALTEQEPGKLDDTSSTVYDTRNGTWDTADNSRLSMHRPSYATETAEAVAA